VIGKPTRVLVVEDSLSVRKRLVELLSAEPDLEVVGEAEDGRLGVAMCRALRPDVVTMDMAMPIMTGLHATEQIMAECPTPILILSASFNRDETHQTFDALAAGAVDVLDKPGPGELPARWAEKLRAAVRMVAKIRVIRHPRARLRRAPEPSAVRAEAGARCAKRLAVIGGSTGAPAAIAEILRRLPAAYPLPVVVVIHISPQFAGSLADWLAAQSALRVTIPADGEPLPRSGVWLAPASRHLVVRGGLLRLDDGPERHACCPSIDVLFESVAEEIGAGAVACLLTGMGADGAAGLLRILRAGGETIAQDEATSQIYGMPREAVRLGAAARVLPLDGIAKALLAAAGEAGPHGGGGPH
jgi:two-component system chemotaxis response regulator CheB